MVKENRYSQIIEAIFYKYYSDGATEVEFDRTDINKVADELNIRLPKNLGDVIYSFRYRANLPSKIMEIAPEGHEWIIRPTGRGSYKFALITTLQIVPSEILVVTKIPDATPDVIKRYALNDEQGLLTKLRYNRLIDIFTGITCYSLQNHLRTTVPGIGQVETDEIYIGLDKYGAHYILPVQAKVSTDRLGIVQIEQDFALCDAKFPKLICRPIAAQFMDDEVIALFQFEQTEEGIAVSSERHYKLVPQEELSLEEIERYSRRTS